MKIKALWGFVGNAEKLNADSATIRAGDTFDDVDKDYAMALIGKGLAEAMDGKAAPKADKQAKPDVPVKAAASSNKQAKAGEGK
ncbi:hypothetical protein [Thermomonas sp.]